MPTTVSDRAPHRGTLRVPALFFLLLAALLAAPGSAHVQLDAPNGGEVLMAETQVEIEWHVLISHATENWDLEYSSTGENGPWISIAEDLPPGNITTNAMHSFLWTVPNVDSDEVRVRVTQDNSGVDYTDASDEDLTVQPVPAVDEVFIDGFELGDTSGWSAVVP